MADESMPGDADAVERPTTTTPTELKKHARTHRGAEMLPSSSLDTGRFGRMFRHLPVFEQPPSHLRKLAAKMVSSGSPAENPDIPSGYTYLGQFIDHDITFDPVSLLQRFNDPDALHDFRTPRFIGLLAGDPASFLKVRPAWKPERIPAHAAGRFTLADLLKFATK